MSKFSQVTQQLMELRFYLRFTEPKPSPFLTQKSSCVIGQMNLSAFYDLLSDSLSASYLSFMMILKHHFCEVSYKSLSWVIHFPDVLLWQIAYGTYFLFSPYSAVVTSLPHQTLSSFKPRGCLIYLWNWNALSEFLSRIKMSLLFRQLYFSLFCSLKKKQQTSVGYDEWRRG